MKIVLSQSSQGQEEDMGWMLAKSQNEGSFLGFSTILTKQRGLVL